MDRLQVDQLARSLAASGSRRGLLGVATAALLPGMGQIADLEAARKKKQRRKQKRKGKNKPGGGTTPQALTFCQGGQTITAAPDQKDAMLAAGATLGACPDPGGRCANTGEACTASTDCCSDQVCGGGKTNAQICRPNHVPVALDISVRNLWRSPCVPVTLQGYEPDFDLARFRFVMQPSEGFLTQYISRSAPGVVTTLEDDRARVRDDNRSAALPAPELPTDLPRNCAPRCLLFDTCPAAEGECPDCTLGVDPDSRSWLIWDEDGNLVPSAASVNRICPEGWYLSESFCYIPYKSTFKGTDAFTYVMVDEHGAEGPEARVNIDIYETD